MKCVSNCGLTIWSHIISVGGLISSLCLFGYTGVMTI